MNVGAWLTTVAQCNVVVVQAPLIAASHYGTLTLRDHPNVKLVTDLTERSAAISPNLYMAIVALEEASPVPAVSRIINMGLESL